MLHFEAVFKPRAEDLSARLLAYPEGSCLATRQFLQSLASPRPPFGPFRSRLLLLFRFCLGKAVDLPRTLMFWNPRKRPDGPGSFSRWFSSLPVPQHSVFGRRQAVPCRVSVGAGGAALRGLTPYLPGPIPKGSLPISVGSLKVERQTNEAPCFPQSRDVLRRPETHDGQEQATRMKGSTCTSQMAF